MISLVLTGGVASGKSSLAKLLSDRVENLLLFDCDAEVGQLLTEEAVLREIRQKLGEGCFQGDELDKAAVRKLVFADPSARKSLEAILHPRVRESLGEATRRGIREGADVLLADIPLYFETGWKVDNRGVLVTACPRDTQKERLLARPGLEEDTAEAILNSQLPWETKVDSADQVFWTSGQCEFLVEQVDVFVEKLQGRIAHDREKRGPQCAIEVPPVTDLNEIRKRPLSELLEQAEGLGVRNTGAERGKLIFDLVCKLGQFGSDLQATGVLEQAKGKFAMLRDAGRSFRAGPDDVYLGAHYLEEFGLGEGNEVTVRVRPPRGRDNYLSAHEILAIEGKPARQFEAGPDFEELTSEFPQDRFHLETRSEDDLAVRLVDLVAPLGRGQRGLIVAPPRGGKTVLLKQIARSIQENHPESKLIILLLDERPEEVSDFEDTVEAEVISSTFDESTKRHAQVADMVLTRARRMVENGDHVVILLDSLTRLARGYNNAASGGPIGSGGVNPNALAKARKFFGAARNVVDGGSLTILATCLVETDSRMDDVIFEELKGTGNMEIRLDRELAERRVFPAIHIHQSGTRNDDRLYHQEELPRVIELRRQLAAMPVGEAVELLMRQLKGTASNAEFLMKGLR
ncbi:transcription termination factor Rho [Roseibacillus ishigakijimensis]|uniref:Multifunctional fusion protein n=1 Tax=Roseibacillus ishigakijimensis TaxID=454146 RepID=A0A934RQ06_9BACT|nr:transcription termination factor Rho [Roseibacillus ishigakijimensis]MBK1834833.1 transcription termination factor Rho [Roseibacillus ishigakijimensis]